MNTRNMNMAVCVTVFLLATTLILPGCNNVKKLLGMQEEDEFPAALLLLAGVSTADNWVQDAYLKAANAQAGDVFGVSAAISGDTLVVGAPWESGSQTTITNIDNTASADNGASASGAVYVFRMAGSGDWVQDAYLKASNAEAGDAFGRLVAISGDTIVVGAVGEGSGQTTISNTDGQAGADNSATGSGAVYIFKKDGSGNWYQDAYLKASNAETGDADIGSDMLLPVAISGDTVAVGMIYEDSSQTTITNIDNTASADNGAPASGAVYVFRMAGSGDWVQDAYLKASNAESGDAFGVSVAVSGNIIVAGAYQEDSNQTTINNTDDDTASANNSAAESGAAYVFKREGSGDWIQDAYLKASNSGTNDLFGTSVSVSGDTIAVGAVAEGSGQTTISNTDGQAGADNNAPTSGAVYVFKKDGSGNWIQDAYLKASNAETNDNFGPVSISGDTIVVGAGGEDSGQTTIMNDDGQAGADNDATDSGAVYVFKRDGNGNWIQDACLKASNAETNDFFGTSVSVSGNTIVVGAYGESSSQNTVTNDDGQASANNNAIASGAVYVFKR